MKTFAVNLPDDLAAFVDAAIASSAWPSRDRLFAHAITLARTEATTGRSPEAKTKSGAIRAVDLTRQNFDSAAFVAGLVDKIQAQRLTQPPPNGS